jgi:enoyl-CoA hydratase
MITVTRDGHVATVTLDRPEKRNALPPSFWEDFPGVVAELDADLEVRAIILRGAGSCFSAGLDVAGTIPALPGKPSAVPDASGKAALHRLVRLMQQTPSSLERSRVPVVAAIHGACIGGGLDIVTACDIRLASADVKFSVRETRLAMVADVGTLQRLPALIGPGHARELIFTGEDFGAERALALGLVNRILPDADALFAEANRVAQAIAANAPLAVQGSKTILNERIRYDTDRLLEYNAVFQTAYLFSKDLMTALTAFMTKQPAEFEGK